MKTKVEKSTRNQILEESAKSLSVNGPLKFEVQQICQITGVNPSMIQYYFGSRENLIQEVAITEYEKYVDEMYEISINPNLSPQIKLSNWINNQINWTKNNPGIAMVLNYPNITIEGENSAKNTNIIDSLKFQSSRNLLGLGQIILEIHGENLNLQTDIESYVKQNPDFALNVGMIGWTAFGLSTWVAGNHLPSRFLINTEINPENYIQPLIQKLVSFVSKSSSK